MGRIARNYFYNAAYQLLILITPIVTAPYLARVLGADNLGIYSYVNSSGNIIITLSLIGIYTYGNRQTAYVRDDKGRLTATFWEIMISRVGLGIIGTSIYLIYAFLNSAQMGYFLIYYPYILAQFLDCSWIYVGLEDMKPTVMKNFAMKLINVAGIFLLVKSRNDLWIYVLLLAVTALLANLSIYTQLDKYIGRPNADLRMIPHHIRGSFALFLPEVAALFYLQVDKVMLKWLTGTSNQVAFYDQAEKIVTIPLSLITVISSVVMPRLAYEFKRDNKEKIQNLLLQAGRYALCMALPMMVGIFCVAEKFIPWYLGDEFQSSAIAIMILSPIVVLNSLVGISGKQYFTATNQTKIILKAYTVAAIMNVIVNAILIPRFGYIGAAIATVLSSLCSVITQFYTLKKQVQIRALWKFGIKYLTGAIIMGIAIYCISYRMKSSAVTTLIQVGVGGLIYMLYLVISRDTTVVEIERIILKKFNRR